MTMTTTMTNKKDDSLDGWRVESIMRFGRTFLVIYKDGEAKGQVEVEGGDKDKWMTLIRSLNV